MQTRDVARPDRDGPAGELVRTALVAGSAIFGTLVLIAVFATGIMCWSIHPALGLTVLIPLGWVLARLGTLVLTTRRRTS
jgi:hypothetical protein